MHVGSDDAGVIKELWEHFTFEVANAKYHPLVKKKRWDGKIHLLRNDGTVYRGLRSNIDHVCHNLGIDIEDNTSSAVLEPFDMARAKDILDRLKAHFPHKPYDHQLLAWHYMVSHRRVTLVSPTASGKSLILFLVLQYYSRRRALLIVPNTNLVLQMRSDLTAYGQDPASIQIMMAGEDKTIHSETKILVSTWQSLANVDDEFLASFQVVMCDEVHHAAAKSLINIIERTVNADIRIGTTGSLDNIKSNEMTIQGLFGPVKRFTTTKKLMDEGKIADLVVHAMKLDYSPIDRSNLFKRMKRVKELSKNTKPGLEDDVRRGMYQEEINYLIEHNGRRKWIRDFVMGLDGNTMVLFNRVAADGELLYREILEAYPDRAGDVFFVSGKTHADDREQIRALLEAHSNAVVIASVSVFSTGTNIKNLHNAVSIAPTKSVVRVLQSIGRTLRLSKGKDHANWYDLVDDLCVGKHMNYAMKHAIQRMKIYKNEGFKVEMKSVSIR